MDAKDKEIRDLRAALLEARTTAYILAHAPFAQAGAAALAGTHFSRAAHVSNSHAQDGVVFEDAERALSLRLRHRSGHKRPASGGRVL